MQTQQADNDMEKSAPRCGASKLYIAITGVVFVALTIVFVFFPRSAYSELEKRDLKEFPNIDEYSGRAGAFTSAVSEWFSDTEPYRDELMTLSMNIRSAMRGNVLPEEEMVSFRPTDNQVLQESVADNNEDTDQENQQESTTEAPANSAVNDDGVAKLGEAGTIIVGKGDKVRALMAFGGTAKGGGGYIDLLNTLAETFPSQKIYAMVAPLATEFYLPAKAAKVSNPQKPFIYGLRDRLSSKVRFVDVYSELAKHTDEDIYLRTDHHWAGLGGYYAAKKLAEAAGVPFRGLDAYEKHVIPGFVGSMYGYTKDIAVKNAPEDFVFYTPNQVKYDAEFVAYTLNKNFKISAESKPYKSAFFKTFKKGSGNAYLTFIGSDQVFVKVKTSTPGSRRLLIIKDSYGNAVPGNLFYSFNEVHVVDFRYFTHNLKKYVADHGITDIAVCFNVFNAYSSGSASKVKAMINQAGGIHVEKETPHDTHENSKTEKSGGKESKSAKPASAAEPEKNIVTPEEPAQTEHKNEPESEPGEGNGAGHDEVPASE